MIVSEQIKSFLDFVEESRSVYEISLEAMKKEDRKLQDFVHAIEFEKRAKERSKIDTKLHRSRVTRRKYKDLVEVYDPMIKFFQDPQNKKTLERMKQLLGEVRKKESSHVNRVYHPRVPEED